MPTPSRLLAPTRLALIDLGTNAVRFDVHELTAAGVPRRLHRERLMVRLGEGVFQSGRLSRAAVARTVAAFQSFRRTCIDLRVDKTVAFGTSALREASDSERFIRLLRDKTGIEVRVISGADEARLIALGILSHENVPKGLFALVDVGGGSVEITLCRQRQVLQAASLLTEGRAPPADFLQDRPAAARRRGRPAPPRARHPQRGPRPGAAGPPSKRSSGPAARSGP